MKYGKPGALKNSLHKPIKQLSLIGAKELNDMPYEEFEMIADIPMNQQTPTYIQAEWKLSQDKNLSAVKRGMFIDELAVSNDKNVIQKFIKTYNETKEPEIKERLILGTMTYYQAHRSEIKVNGDELALKNFYAKLLYSSLIASEADIVIRSYVELSSPEVVLANQKQIDKQLQHCGLHSIISLKLDLARKSLELERIYIPSLIKMLKENNQSELEAAFFARMRYEFTYLQDPNSRSEVRAYAHSVAPKYSTNVSWKDEDSHFMFAKKYFQDFEQASTEMKK